jgi:RNA polymerase sigma-70 factor (ECF subfamily)
MGLEERIASLLVAGDLRAAATASVEGYGSEVLGFLVTFLRDEDDACDAFAQACEDLWRGLDHFERRSSLRTWFYALARHAAARLRRAPERRPERRAPLSELTEVADRLRSRTLPHLRTDVKDRFAAIRNALEKDDRALLVLRVDRGMSWDQIARIYAEDDLSEAALARIGARLRKRFQLVKDEIRTRAREAGLLPEEEP